MGDIISGDSHWSLSSVDDDSKLVSFEIVVDIVGDVRFDGDGSAKIFDVFLCKQCIVEF